MVSLISIELYTGKKVLGRQYRIKVSFNDREIFVMSCLFTKIIVSVTEYLNQTKQVSQPNEELPHSVVGPSIWGSSLVPASSLRLVIFFLMLSILSVMPAIFSSLPLLASLTSRAASVRQRRVSSIRLNLPSLSASSFRARVSCSGRFSSGLVSPLIFSVLYWLGKEQTVL